MTCTPDTLLRDVMKKIVRTHSDHIIVVDQANGKPLKQLSLNDILVKFSPFDFKATPVSDTLSLMSAGDKQATEVRLEAIAEQAAVDDKDEAAAEDENESDSESDDMDDEAALNLEWMDEALDELVDEEWDLFIIQ